MYCTAIHIFEHNLVRFGSYYRCRRTRRNKIVCNVARTSRNTTGVCNQNTRPKEQEEGKHLALLKYTV